MQGTLSTTLVSVMLIYLTSTDCPVEALPRAEGGQMPWKLSCSLVLLLLLGCVPL